MIRLSEEQIAAIGAHGARDFPRECVGVLLGDIEGDVRIVRELRLLDNTFEPEWETKERASRGLEGDTPGYGQERRYLLSPDVMFALMREERRTGRKVLGFYHSHPDHPARPSEFDREWASPWYTYLIVSVMQGRPEKVTAWQLNDDRAAFVPETIDRIA